MKIKIMCLAFALAFFATATNAEEISDSTSENVKEGYVVPVIVSSASAEMQEGNIAKINFSVKNSGKEAQRFRYSTNVLNVNGDGVELYDQKKFDELVFLFPGENKDLQFEYAFSEKGKLGNSFTVKIILEDSNGKILDMYNAGIINWEPKEKQVVTNNSNIEKKESSLMQKASIAFIFVTVFLIMLVLFLRKKMANRAALFLFFVLCSMLYFQKAQAVTVSSGSGSVTFTSYTRADACPNPGPFVCVASGVTYNNGLDYNYKTTPTATIPGYKRGRAAIYIGIEASIIDSANPINGTYSPPTSTTQYINSEPPISYSVTFNGQTKTVFTNATARFEYCGSGASGCDNPVYYNYASFTLPTSPGIYNASYTASYNGKTSSGTFPIAVVSELSGACDNGPNGQNSGVPKSTAPTSFCSSGFYNNDLVSNATTWNWRCYGGLSVNGATVDANNLGVFANCSANKIVYSCTAGASTANATLCTGDNTGLSANTPNTLVSTCGVPKCEYTCNSGFTLFSGACRNICGSANGGTYSTAPTINLCGTGSSIIGTVTDSGTNWTWTCAGTSDGRMRNCSAIKGACVVSYSDYQCTYNDSVDCLDEANCEQTNHKTVNACSAQNSCTSGYDLLTPADCNNNGVACANNDQTCPDCAPSDPTGENVYREVAP